MRTPDVDAACSITALDRRPCRHADRPVSQLYPAHLATCSSALRAGAAAGGYDHLVIAAGLPHYQFLDDRTDAFAVNPHFKAWLPVTKAPGSWLVITPGQRPKLVYLQPHDYWHVVPAAPSGYWVEHFDIAIIREPQQALEHLAARPGALRHPRRTPGWRRRGRAEQLPRRS